VVGSAWADPVADQVGEALVLVKWVGNATHVQGAVVNADSLSAAGLIGEGTHHLTQRLRAEAGKFGEQLKLLLNRPSKSEYCSGLVAAAKR
jgi:hypothetical protein